MLADVPKQKLITPSIISEKLKVNGSLARKAVRELVSKNLIRTRCTIATNGARTVHKPFLQTHPSTRCRERNGCRAGTGGLVWSWHWTGTGDW